MTSKSPMLRIRDVRDAYRLIGECRDLSGPVHYGMPTLIRGGRPVPADSRSTIRRGSRRRLFVGPAT